MTLQIQGHPSRGGPMILQIRWSHGAANPAPQVVPSACKLAWFEDIEAHHGQH